MFKRPSNRTVVTTVNDCAVNVKQMGHNQQQQQHQQQLNLLNGNHNASYLQSTNITGSLHSSTTVGQQQQQQLTIPLMQNYQKPLESPEDGRINYSKRAQSHGTRHVVNMLGELIN